MEVSSIKFRRRNGILAKEGSFQSHAAENPSFCASASSENLINFTQIDGNRVKEEESKRARSGDIDRDDKS